VLQLTAVSTHLPDLVLFHPASHPLGVLGEVRCRCFRPLPPPSARSWLQMSSLTICSFILLCSRCFVACQDFCSSLHLLPLDEAVRCAAADCCGLEVSVRGRQLLPSTLLSGA
jgi:hypothetical protein